jgi:hypothetical protein
MTKQAQPMTIKTNDVIIVHGEPTKHVVTRDFVDYLRSKGASPELIRAADRIVTSNETAKLTR